MKSIIKGLAYVVEDDIDTDQIIPAQYLVYDVNDPEERKIFGRHALSGIPDEKAGLPFGNISFVSEGGDRSSYKIIIAGKNFGCGSSREHAPIALAEAGVEAIIALSYARIFYRNAVDGGLLIPYESRKDITDRVNTGDMIEIDTKSCIVTNHSKNWKSSLNPLGPAEEIISAGGLFQYARKKKII